MNSECLFVHYLCIQVVCKHLPHPLFVFWRCFLNAVRKQSPLLPWKPPWGFPSQMGKVSRSRCHGASVNLSSITLTGSIEGNHMCALILDKFRLAWWICASSSWLVLSLDTHVLDWLNSTLLLILVIGILLSCNAFFFFYVKINAKTMSS